MALFPAESYPGGAPFYFGAVPRYESFENCEHCAWSQEITSQARVAARVDWKECAFNPPQAVQAFGGMVFLFPEVRVDQKCGRWTPK